MNNYYTMVSYNTISDKHEDTHFVKGCSSLNSWPKDRYLNHELPKDRNLNSLEAQATMEYQAILIFLFYNLLILLIGRYIIFS